MQLTGINIRNFRSIGDDEVVLTPLRKCNILIGRNNVGKSNSLKAIQLILPILRKHYTNNITEREQQSFRQLERNDLHMQNSQAELKYILQFTADADQDQALVEKAGMNVFAFEISLKLPEKPELVNYSFTDLTDFRTAERLLPFISNSHFT